MIIRQALEAEYSLCNRFNIQHLPAAFFQHTLCSCYAGNLNGRITFEFCSRNSAS